MAERTVSEVYSNTNCLVVKTNANITDGDTTPYMSMGTWQCVVVFTTGTDTDLELQITPDDGTTDITLSGSKAGVYFAYDEANNVGIVQQPIGKVRALGGTNTDAVVFFMFFRNSNRGT